jgi:hypothetical protein
MASTSILADVKSQLNVPSDTTAFDTDIITGINTAFMILHQLGLGPSDPFGIIDDTATWDEFTIDISKYAGVKTYVFLKVRSIFDPPTTAHLLSALKDQITELEIRLRDLFEYNNPPVEEEVIP